MTRTRPLGYRGVQLPVTKRHPFARKNCIHCKGGGEVPDDGFLISCICVKRKIKRIQKRFGEKADKFIAGVWAKSDAPPG